MPENISRQIIKRKALERWENEGGRISAGQPGKIKSGSPDKREGQANAAQISNSPTAERPQGRKNKGGRI